MTQNAVDKAADYITESAHQAARATGAMADAIDDGAKVARRVARQSCDAAEEFVNDTRDFVNDATKFAKRNPWPTMAATLMVGVISGLIIGGIMRRR